MRWERLRAKGIGPFREEIDLDLTALPGLLVAITGSNGSGKSTMLSLLPGAIYRDCPTRGTLAQLANSRDAYVEIDVVNGQRYRIRQNIDSHTGKGETLITDSDGRPVVASGKMRDADRYIAQHLPPADVVYASIFAPQGSAGFLGMTAGERKAVLLRTLGIERLEALAEKARERARDTKQELATLQARIADEEARASDPAVVSATLEALRVEHATLTSKVAQDKAALEAAQAAEQVARLAVREAEAYTMRRAELVAQMQRASIDVTDIEKRLENNRGVLRRGDVIRAAQERCATLDAEIAKLTPELSEARSAAFAAETSATALERRREELERRQASAIAPRIARLETLLRDRDKVRDAEAALPTLQQSMVDAEATRDAVLTTIEETNGFALAAADVRIKGLRQGHVFVGRSETLQDAVAEAAAALDADDEASIRATQAPSRLADLRGQLSSANAAVTTARTALGAAEAVVANAAAIANAEAELVAADAEREALVAEQASMASELDSLRAQQDDADQLVACLDEQLKQLRSERDDLAPELAFIQPLAQAEARVAELEPRLEAARKLVTETGEALAALGDMPTMMPMPDVLGARTALETSEAALRSCEARIAVTEAQLTDAKASAERFESMGIQRRIAEDNLADWTRLADDLGRDGVQALEIDAAGPEITEITNDLLSKSFGNRFTVSFVTTRRASDNKRDLEAFDVSVLDSEKAREGEASTYSGGEKVILGEAVSLALTTVACRRSGLERVSLIRDESGAALDGANAIRYVGMLRRAADLIGADKVLLVSHSAAVQELADARVRVSDGRLEVAA